MVSFSGARAADSEAVMNKIQNREWGLLLLDEVHVVPAKTFRSVVNKIHAHTKIGLSATLVREDEMIEDLNFLIGPKLYEANWLQLVNNGHLAKVQCTEVWCPMTTEFYRCYLTANAAKGRLLYVMNPNKYQTCQYLIRHHEARVDKILVSSHNIYALVSSANKLQKPHIAGSTKDSERMRIFSSFKYDANVKTIFISKVGDNSIDLPEANVILQISSHFGSRRQEAQRLGRILRPKSGNILREVDEYDAFFYSLVSQDTVEMQYSTKRQQFLVDQGYAFKIISEIPLTGLEGLVYSTQEEQNHLLAQVLAADDKNGEVEETVTYDWMLNTNNNTENRNTIMRAEGSLSLLSGDDGSQYSEYYVV